MFCSKCGFNNDNSAHFCRNCGEPLNPPSNIQSFGSSSQSSKGSSSKNNTILIVAVTLIIISLIVAGVLLYASSNNLMSGSDSSASGNGNTNDAEVATPSENSNADENSQDSTLEILGGSFSTDSPLPAKTYITLYVGKEHAGEKCKIRVFYSYGGSQLNAGNIVSKTVDSSGHFTMKTANKLEYYPDHASVTLYDGNGNVVDTREINMSPVAGTQTF